MTLHWWMHWFWVTAQFIVILGSPLPSTTTEPRNQAQDHLETEKSTEIESIGTESPYDTELSTIRQQSFRIAKAIGLYPPTNTAVMLERQITTSAHPFDHTGNTETSPRAIVISSQQGTFNATLSANNVASYRNRAALSQRTTGADVMDRIRAPVAKKDSKITWIDTSDKTRSKYSNQEETLKQQHRLQHETVENATEVEDLTVLPLQEEGSKFRLVLNRTRATSSFLSSSSSLSASSSATGKVGIRTFNRSEDDVVVDEELVEPRPLATAASILEVGVSRTRSAFPRDFQRDQVQGSSSDYIGNSSDGSEEYGSSSRSAVDIAAITGSCLATVVLLSTMGSLGFIMYRRRYLNPPQTLNSDKCSNPDSSGYIDDSTIRDNSEEMYSLDNDSFLNSLEAMTIQNYWTDSVKHTKL